MMSIIRLTLLIPSLLIVFVSTAHAKVTWGTPSFGSGPTGWDGDEYVLNIDRATGIGSDEVCLDWSYEDTSAKAHSGSVTCTKAMGNDYQCRLPGTSVPYANTSGVAWAFYARPSCAAGLGTGDAGPTSAASPGPFGVPNGTGPNAIALRALTAHSAGPGLLAWVSLVGLSLPALCAARRSWIHHCSC